MLKWLKMGCGHGMALLLFFVGGYAGIFSVTILLDGLVRRTGTQTDGLIVGTLLYMIAAAGVGLGGWLLYHLGGTELPSEGTTRELGGSEEPLALPSLHQLREGYVVDYDLRTGTVADHAKYPYEGRPTDVWTLDGARRAEGRTLRVRQHPSGRGVLTVEFDRNQQMTPPPAFTPEKLFGGLMRSRDTVGEAAKWRPNELL